MKKFFNKLKAGLVTFRIALISFPLKVKGLNNRKQEKLQPDYWIYHPPIQWLYWVPSPVEPAETIVDTIIKIAPRLLIAITFIVGIVSFIKIRKIGNKTLKKKKIRSMIYIMIILIILIIIGFWLSSQLLGRCTTC